MAEQIYRVQDPSGNMREIAGPPGATDEEIIAQAQQLFGSTAGGAATGNPSIQAQGRKALRQDVSLFGPAAAIAGATGIGAAMGAVGGDVLQGVGRAVGATPQGRALGPVLENTGRAMAANRGQAALIGAVTGAAGESAGQMVELSGGPQWLAEGARFGVGALTPELAKAATHIVKNVGPFLLSWKTSPVAKALATKLEGGELKSLTEREAEYLNQLRDELRGGAKSDVPLDAVGASMGQEAARFERGGQIALTRAQADLQNLSPVTQRTLRESADIGGELSGAINQRLGVSIAARDKAYANNQRARDAVVSGKENAGTFVNSMPEYQALLDSIKAQLVPGQRDPDVQAGLQKVLNSLSNPDKDVFGQAKPITFQALDDLRRKLGEAYRGKPDQGYEAIKGGIARDLYNRVSNIQKQFAGPVQSKLLDDYAMRTEGLEVFHSMRGRKATAMDRYDPTQFATDPSSLPGTYFKTRASIEALKELTGNVSLVNRAAIDHAAAELQGATGPQARAWLQKNSEWLGEVPMVRQLVDRYATRLEGAERGLANAQEFAKQAAKDANLLRGSSLPAQRAVDLIKSGNVELWEKAAPAIANSPQSKQILFSAARQVLADEATSKGVIDFFSRNLRPMLERTGSASATQLDFVAQKLAQIKNLQLPEQEKLGMAKRLLLQGIAMEAASGTARIGASAWEPSKQVPD